MSENITLEANVREITGKKVKQLRRAGQIPAVIYGPEFENINLVIPELELRQTLAQAGGTQIIELHIGKDKMPALVKKVQRDPIRGDLLHVDFYHVAMDRVIRAEVPLLLVNEPPMVVRREAIATQILSSVEVEALPADFPPHIDVDISVLNEVGEHLLISDLYVPDTLTIIADPDELIVKLDYAQALEVEEEEEEELLEVVGAAGEVEVITERKEEEEE